MRIAILMPLHSEQRILPYTPEQLFTLVADIEKYPEFLPWCVGCKITDQQDTIMYADLIIGHKMIRERFSSKVTLDYPNHIHVEYLKGPMEYLSNDWHFSFTLDGGCMIDFHLEFEFKNPALKALMGVFFHEAVRRMVGAFEKRAGALY